MVYCQVLHILVLINLRLCITIFIIICFSGCLLLILIELMQCLIVIFNPLSDLVHDSFSLVGTFFLDQLFEVKLRLLPGECFENYGTQTHEIIPLLL